MSTIDTEYEKPGNFIVRFLLTVFYLAVLFVVRFVLWGVLIVQLVAHLISGQSNRPAARVGEAVADYIYRIWRFLSYNTNERPFPFGSRKHAD